MGKTLNDSIGQYRVRRDERLNIRYRLDEEDGQWITTKSGNKIHISEERNIDKANPHVVAAIKNESSVGMARAVYLVSVVTDNSAYTAIMNTQEEAERYADEVRGKAQVITIIQSE